MRVAVIDYGMGNLRSVVKAIEYVAPQANVQLTSDPAEVAHSDRVVFPGQGAIAGCMMALDQSHLRDAVLAAVQTKPFLGICLGLQVLFDLSDEGGGVKALGVFPETVTRFRREIKTPHIGWNRVWQNTHHLWKDIPDGSRFYFAHSYRVSESAYTVGETINGDRFVSAIAKDNIFAVQFHPEKSSVAGLQLLLNFITWDD